MPHLGAHLSAAGGVSRAAAAARTLGCEALQVFLRPPGRWHGAPIPAEEVERFRDASAAGGLAGRCFAHAPYLLNLASPDPALRQRSTEVLAEELTQAGRLGLAGLVLHPGSATGSARRDAEKRCRRAIGDALAAAGPDAAPLLLEGSAGAGGQLGRTPAELARLVPRGGRDRVGVCLDTAHLWAAGVNLLGDGFELVMAELAACWGRSGPELLHGNDSKATCGSHRDRHAVPGEGALGETFYRRLLADPRLAGVPVVLEIPPGAGNANVRRALKLLRGWTDGAGEVGRRRPRR